MYPVRADFALILVAMLLAMLLGCSTEAPSDGNSAASTAREKRFTAKSQEFADHLLAGRLAEAHAMTSSHYQTRYDFAQFEQFWKTNMTEFEQFGPAKCASASIGFENAAEFDKDDLPAGVPLDSIEASAFILFAIEGECEDPDRCYEMYVLFVNDGGEDRIADVSIDWCD